VIQGLLEKARTAAGWSLRKAGEVFGVDHTQVHRWEHGANLDPIRYFLTVAGASEAGRLATLRAMGGGIQEMMFDEQTSAEYGDCVELLRRHRGNEYVEVAYRGLMENLRLADQAGRPGGGVRGQR
jgi:hypothetical protein